MFVSCAHVGPRVTGSFLPRQPHRIASAIVATLRIRIKTLEEKNRELTALLELAYGRLALAREKNASVRSGF